MILQVGPPIEATLGSEIYETQLQLGYKHSLCDLAWDMLRHACMHGWMDGRICLSLYICMPRMQRIHASILSVYLSAYLSISLSFFRSIYLSFYLSIYLASYVCT